MTKSDAFHVLQTFLLLGIIVVLWFVWEKVSIVYAIAKREEAAALAEQNRIAEEHYLKERPLDLHDLDDAIEQAGFHDYRKGLPPV